MTTRKQILLLLVLCINYLFLQATNCSDKYFIEEHATIAICKNYGRGMDGITPYYKGITKALSDYIALKIERGELKNKRFEIYMLDPILTRPHYSLTQNSKAYYIQTGRTLDMDELMQAVDEFTRPDFTAIDIGIWGGEQEEYEKQTRQFEKVEEKLLGKTLSKEDTDFIKSKEYIIYQQNELKVIYNNDSVKCFIQDKKIEANLFGWPCAIKDRYIIQECGIFYVYQDTTLIKRFKYEDEYCDIAMEAKVFDKWVNFSTYSNEDQYSYSYDKNRFYAVEPKDN